MSDKKICRNCKHSRRDWFFGWAHAKCKAPQWADTSVVTGKVVYPTIYCENQRIFTEDRYCGPSGQWYEPKGKMI